MQRTSILKGACFVEHGSVLVERSACGLVLQLWHTAAVSGSVRVGIAEPTWPVLSLRRYCNVPRHAHDVAHKEAQHCPSSNLQSTAKSICYRAERASDECCQTRLCCY